MLGARGRAPGRGAPSPPRAPLPRQPRSRRRLRVCRPREAQPGRRERAPGGLPGPFSSTCAASAGARGESPKLDPGDGGAGGDTPFFPAARAARGGGPSSRFLVSSLPAEPRRLHLPTPLPGTPRNPVTAGCRALSGGPGHAAPQGGARGGRGRGVPGGALGQRCGRGAEPRVPWGRDLGAGAREMDAFGAPPFSPPLIPPKPAPRRIPAGAEPAGDGPLRARSVAALNGES